MTVPELYATLNADYADACKRMISGDVVARFVRKFPADPSMQMLRDAVAAGDIEASFRAVHTLKGVSGTLGLTQLFQASIALTEQLRPRLETADITLFEAVDAEYQRTIDAIAQLD